MNIMMGTSGIPDDALVLSVIRKFKKGEREREVVLLSDTPLHFAH